MTAELFLTSNDVYLTATDAECITTFVALAAGELTEDDLAEWIAANSAAISQT